MSFSLIRSLPAGVSHSIFYYLTSSELLICKHVSKEWGGFADDRIAWEEIAKRIFNGLIPKYKNLKSFILKFQDQELRTNLKIIERIVVFANKINLGKNGVFRCFLGSENRHQILSLEIKGSQSGIVDIREETRAPNVEEGIVFEELEFPGYPEITYQSNPRFQYQPILAVTSEGVSFIYREATYQNRHFKAVLRFPTTPVWIFEQSEMEFIINEIMVRTIESMVQQDKQRCVIS